jgi:hypothetical protein
VRTYCTNLYVIGFVVRSLLYWKICRVTGWHTARNVVNLTSHILCMCASTCWGCLLLFLFFLFLCSWSHKNETITPINRDSQIHRKSSICFLYLWKWNRLDLICRKVCETHWGICPPWGAVIVHLIWVKGWYWHLVYMCSVNDALHTNMLSCMCMYVSVSFHHIQWLCLKDPNCSEYADKVHNIEEYKSQ